MNSPKRRSPNRSEIEACIERRAFRLEYQPVVHLDTGTLAGVEALCRFTDGAPTESRFRQCERLGLAPALDFAIIDAALADLPQVPGDFVAVNLSPSTLLDERLADALLAPGVPCDRLVIEVTEHARIRDYERAQRLLASIRGSGIRVAVDDAGAGYATFRHILALRPDVIKMDRSITQNIDSDTARRALATALVIFAGEVGASVVAEGVETEAEIVALRRAGIHRGQGYALARPAPLPLAPLTYSPVPLHEVLDLTPSRSEMPLPLDDGATGAVTAHRLLASVDAISGVLDMLNERLSTIGEERYRGLVGTAQRQAHHVEGTLRAVVQGVPLEPRPLAAADTRSAVQSADGEADTDGARGERRDLARALPAPLKTSGSQKLPARSHALERLRAAVNTADLARSGIDDAVGLSRKAGVTWDEIAGVLGITRQGARKRYGTTGISTPGRPAPRR
ncbi:MAG: EAL domain-containing protein [Acidimicrobiia bacterium]|nr:EAL domain-containing protein [Acidimicrobiia bacterium]